MHFVFAVFKYFPFGGLQKDMVAIACQCIARGHRVTVYCQDWQGEKVEGIEVVVLPVKGISNHRRDAQFVDALGAALTASEYDCLVGFNKMPGLAIYYAADSCYRAKVLQERSFLSRLTPRFRFYAGMEQAVFGGDTDVLMISPKEVAVFQHYYGTPDKQLHLLPPGIRRDRIMPGDYADRRRQFRATWGLAGEDKLLLAVGSGFRTKGLDRSITALASLPAAQLEKTWLYVIGQDKPGAFQRLATKLGVDQRIRFLGGRDDIPEFLWGADLLLHPAYRENTGTVLLEAMVAGLPVITTDACGYAPYVVANAMGVVISSPYRQAELDEALGATLGQEATGWREKGRQFAGEADIYQMPERAADLIISLGKGRDAGIA